MNQPPFNASAEDLQEEINFTQILLATLDTASDTYWSDKHEREQHIVNLQSRLDAMQGNMPGPAYANLQPFQRPSQSDGLYQQFNDPYASLSSGGRKRPRAFEDTLTADYANKSSRTTPSPAATTPGTSSSNDSFPELFENWPSQSQPGDVRHAHASLNHALDPYRQGEAERGLLSTSERFGQDIAQPAFREQQYQPFSNTQQPPSISVRSPNQLLAPASQSGTSARCLNGDGSFQVPLRNLPYQNQPFQRSVSSQSLYTHSPRPVPHRLPSMPHAPGPHPVSSRSVMSDTSHGTPLRTSAFGPDGYSHSTAQAGSSQAGANTPAIEIIDLCESDSESDVQEINPFQYSARQQQFRSFGSLQSRNAQQGSHFSPSHQLFNPGFAGFPAGQPVYNALLGTANNPVYLDGLDDMLEIIDQPFTRGDFGRQANFFGQPCQGSNGLGSMPGAYPSFTDSDAFFGRDQALDRQSAKDALEMLGNIGHEDEISPDQRLSTPDALAVQLMEHQKLGVSWMNKMEQGSNKGSILADEMGLGKTVQALSLIVSRPSEDPKRKTTLVIAPVALMRQWEREIKTKIKDSHKLRVITYHGSKKPPFRELRQYDIVLTSFGTVTSEFSRKERIREFEAQDATNLQDTLPNSKKEEYTLLGKDAFWYRVILDEAHTIRNKETKASRACCDLKTIYRLCMTGTPMMNRTDELYGLVKFLRIKPYCEWKDFKRDIKASLEKGAGDTKKDGMRKLQALLKAILLRRTQESKIDGKIIFELPPKTILRVHVVFDEEQRKFYNALETKTQLKFSKYLKKGTVGKQYSQILVLLLRLRQACCHPHLLKDFAEPAAGIPEEARLDFASQLSEEVVARIKAEDGAFSCPICLDGVENPAIFLPCGHNACSECFARITSDPPRTDEGYTCPNCRGKLDPKRITDYRAFRKVHMPGFLPDDDHESFVEEGTVASSEESDSEEDDEEDDLNGFIVPDDKVEGPSTDRQKQRPKKAKGKERRLNQVPKQKKTLAQLRREAHMNISAKRRYFKRLCKDWVTSAKVDKTMMLLKDIRNADPTEKTLVFSQFTSLLDIVEVPLNKEGFSYTRLDGTMSPDMRNDAVNRFIDSPTHNVMLVSLKAGNAGLNLNAASQVILLDPFWNPYIEYQAIGRAHRLGQNRAVTVHRILVQMTVEDRIMDLQSRKEEMISKALDEEAGKSIAQLGVKDLAFLFGVPMPDGNEE